MIGRQLRSTKDGQQKRDRTNQDRNLVGLKQDKELSEKIQNKSHNKESKS